jgi:hypothetical protein
MEQKRSFLILLALDIERHGGKRNPAVWAWPCHPGIGVTGIDDQRLHAAGERQYREGAADRALLR